MTKAFIGTKYDDMPSSDHCQSDETLILILGCTATFNEVYLSKIRVFGEQRLIVSYSILAA